MKGNYFEQLLGRDLEKDGVQAPQYRNLGLRRDWPDRDGRKDNGIDLAAERQGRRVSAGAVPVPAGSRVTLRDLLAMVLSRATPCKLVC